MTGGTITGNTVSQNGGGIYSSNGTFTMNNGTISNNTASQKGGGIYNNSNITFNMNGGIVNNNTSSYGGGIYNSGTFNIKDGTIFGNTASQYGGGICVSSNSRFTKAGGTIFGYTFGLDNSNMVKDNTGTVQSNKGHAVYVDYNIILIHKETDTEPEINLSWNGTVNPPTFSGGWEY